MIFIQQENSIITHNGENFNRLFGNFSKSVIKFGKLILGYLKSAITHKRPTQVKDMNEMNY